MLGKGHRFPGVGPPPTLGSPLLVTLGTVLAPVGAPRGSRSTGSPVFHRLRSDQCVLSSAAASFLRWLCPAPGPPVSPRPGGRKGLGARVGPELCCRASAWAFTPHCKGGEGRMLVEKATHKGKGLGHPQDGGCGLISMVLAGEAWQPAGSLQQHPVSKLVQSPSLFIPIGLVCDKRKKVMMIKQDRTLLLI